jgi:hypothetical protein
MVARETLLGLVCLGLALAEFLCHRSRVDHRELHVRPLPRERDPLRVRFPQQSLKHDLFMRPLGVLEALGWEVHCALALVAVGGGR